MDRLSVPGAGYQNPRQHAGTFGTMNADVLVDSEPGFKPMNFVEIIRKSPWDA